MSNIKSIVKDIINEADSDLVNIVLGLTKVTAVIFHCKDKYS